MNEVLISSSTWCHSWHPVAQMLLITSMSDGAALGDLAERQTFLQRTHFDWGPVPLRSELCAALQRR